MGSNITCSTLVATLAVIMVLSLFTPASNRDINRMMLSPIVDISVIDTQVSLRLFPQKKTTFYYAEIKRYCCCKNCIGGLQNRLSVTGEFL